MPGKRSLNIVVLQLFNSKYQIRSLNFEYYINKVKNKKVLRKFICITILIIEVTCIVLSSGNKLRYQDERDYLLLAQNIKNGYGYVNEYHEPTAFRAPIYPLFLSILISISSKPIFIKIIQILFFLGTALLLSKIFENYFTQSGLVFLALGFYPVLAYTAGTIYPQTLGVFFLILSLYLLKNSRLVWYSFLLIGLTWGILVLTIPTFLALVPIVLIYIFVNVNKGIRLKILYSFSLVFGIAVVLSPWIYRNYIQFDTFIPLTTNAGINLLYGNSENTKPNTGVNADISKYLENTDTLTEVQKNNYFTKAAVKWIVNNPILFSELYFEKVINYFNYKNKLATNVEAGSFYDIVMCFTYYPFLFLSILQLVLLKDLKYQILNTCFTFYTLEMP